jgi:ABC-type branched-subunit amino acid transport system substrate-binding protein
MLRTLTIAAIAACAAAAAQAQVKGVTPTEIRMGTHVDLSGPLTFWGVPMRNGHILRIEEQNAKGGVHGRKLTLIAEDNAYDPKKGVLATQKLIQKDEVFAMVGVLGTPIALASMPMVLDAGVPHMFPGSPHRAMFEPYHKLKFTLAAAYDDMVRAGVKYMIESKGKKRIAIMYQDDDFGKDIRDATLAQAKKMNIPVVSVTSYKRGDTAFSSQVARMRQDNPDLIVAATIIRETVGLAAELRKVGWSVDVMTTAAACNSAIVDIGKEAVEGLYVQCQYVPFDPDTDSPAVKDWAKRYQARFNQPATIPAAMGYNMQELMIHALEKAGKDVTVDKFIAAMETVKDWQDMFGTPPLTFTKEQRIGTRAFVLTQVTKGKFKRITGALTE